MLKECFEKGVVFKLACGSGNEDPVSVERLVAVYAKAGAHYFDLSANEEILEAAYRGLDRVIPKEEQVDYHFCISIGIKGDPHARKSKINEKGCFGCSRCAKQCMQNAIRISNGKAAVTTEKCLGCGQCVQVCENGCIQIVSEEKDLDTVLPPLIERGISTIELHAASDDIDNIVKKWKSIENIYHGMMSIGTDRSHLSDKKLVELIEKLTYGREPYSTIVQADGCPMLGGKDDYGTTLQAVAIAQIINRANLPVYLIMSGGTNSKTMQLANVCNVKADGIALGSYARNAIKEYLEDDRFFETEIFEKALEIAMDIVEESIK